MIGRSDERGSGISVLAARHDDDDSNCCCSCSFEAEIIKIGQASHKMYSNNIVNFQESTTILNACTKKSGNLLNAPHTLLQNVFIGTLNKLNASIQSVLKRFCNHSMTNVFNFFSFPEKKKTFVTILPKNFNLPPVTPLAIFFRSN